MVAIKRVVVGISGGVDSAVSALFLKAKGYDVIGAFMRNWDLNDEIGLCSSSEDEQDSEMLCDHLKIKFHCINFVKEYWNDVFSYLLNDYIAGYTPNPDIMCNRKIKFDAFYNYARHELGADAIATGHYARTTYGDFLQDYKKSLGVRLLRAVDTFKDQTFFLSQVKQEPLQRTMFPLGNICKSEVKRIAMDAGLNTFAKKKESTGICFIGTRNFQNFISEYVEERKGNFIDVESGCVIGEHNGVHNWTLGQRCRIAGVKERYYTVKKDSSSQTIYVASGKDHPALFTQSFTASEVHWIHSVPKDLTEYGILLCQFRFQHTKPLLNCCVVALSESTIFVKLELPLKAVTPGQYAVFYKEQECLGSSRILYVGPSLFSLNEKVNKEGLLYS
ncbi:hypothetical protein R5R35_008263 [Gryllus longicercus]|uniref:tRNA-5-taurinomethyluridine 2-sulfurtransferase n=1 Tax=Gryllus longicercus TaxID=2509291 RepID=A0AAN9W0U6_9ORTH